MTVHLSSLSVAFFQRIISAILTAVGVMRMTCWVPSSQAPGRDGLYSNQVSWLEMVGGFRGRRWLNSLHSQINGLASFLQSMQELEKGVIKHCYLGAMLEFRGDGMWSPNYNFKWGKSLPVGSILDLEQGKEEVGLIFCKFPVLIWPKAPKVFINPFCLTSVAYMHNIITHAIYKYGIYKYIVIIQLSNKLVVYIFTSNLGFLPCL